jgi:hypothetical protein
VLLSVSNLNNDKGNMICFKNNNKGNTIRPAANEAYGRMAFVLVLFIISCGFVHGQQDSLYLKFHSLLNSQWMEEFNDPLTGQWYNNWFLDGEQASISHSEKGMDYWAGPNALDDASHAVLWTKKSFTGDLLIEYEFSRLDTTVRFVNIIYIQATGSGDEGFDHDITSWNEYRKVPVMSDYFLNMHTYHISYAAFGTQNNDPGEDYVRARRYMPSFRGLRNTNLIPDYERTGLFQTGVPHRITIIKKDDELFFHVANHEKQQVFYWKNNSLPPITEGRIGLRHMYTRGSRYSGFKVSVPAR